MCDSCEWESVLDQANEMLDDDTLQFASDTVEGIRDWIEEKSHCTESQKTALDNIQERSNPE